MSLKKLGVILIAVVALGAVFASGASAAKVTKASQWYTSTAKTGGTETTLAADKTITAKIATHPVIGAKFELNTTIGTTNVPLKLTATSLECVGCQVTNMATGTVKTADPVVAYGTGQIRFKGVTVDLPSTECTAAGVNAAEEVETTGTVTTRPLKVHGDWMDEASPVNNHGFQEFIPASGTVFATIKIAGTPCAGIAGKYNVTGTVFSEAKLNTGEYEKVQENTFSQAIQETMGAELKLGTAASSHKAELTGTGAFELGGSFFTIK